MQIVLTIAGFDPSSGAGVTADLMVFAAHGLFGTSAITSLTVQSTLGVVSSHPVDAVVLAETLRCLDTDVPPAGIKIGMLATAENVRAVVACLAVLRGREPHLPVVLDPVLRSSSGRELLDAEGTRLLRERLLPLVDWVTPNLDELALLSGEAVRGRDEMVAAAEVLRRGIGGGRVHVLAKGGHLEGAGSPDLLLTRDGEASWLEGERVQTRATHGTGCALSSALLSRLVLGDAPRVAAQGAKVYVSEAMRRAEVIGHGRGPMNHLWPLRADLPRG